MTRDEFLVHLQERFPDLRFEADPLNRDCLRLPAEAFPSVFQHLRDDGGTRMHYLEFMTASDHPPTHLALVYYLYSYEHRHRLALKVDLPRDGAAIPSLAQVWENADWNEREVYDLFGVDFTGHPDLRRIMMPDDWEGHPLRKDYSHPNLVPRPD